MMMNILQKLIPDNDSKWIIKNNIIYYDSLVKIPVLILEDDKFWVYIDRRVRKSFMKMILFLNKNNIDFYFRSRFCNDYYSYYEKNFHNINLKAYLYLFEDCHICSMIHSGKFPYNLILIKYLKKFDCMDAFIEEFNDTKKELLSSYYDYHSNKSIYLIDNQETRGLIKSLDRTIKIEYIIN